MNRFASILGVLVALASTKAAADPPPVPPASDGDALSEPGAEATHAPPVPEPVGPPLSPTEIEAQGRYHRGVDLYDRDQLELALEEFRRAYELAPNYRVLYNLGLVNARLGRAVRAIEHLTRYLEEGGSSIEPPRIAEVRASIDEQMRRTSILRLHATPSGATVFVDGRAISGSPIAVVRVTAGEHSVEVTAEGHDPVRAVLRVAGGEVAERDFVLTRRTEATARLRIEGTLLDVELHIDGRRVGVTPIDRSVALTPGEHRISLVREGYERRDVRREVEAGEIIVVDADLEASRTGQGEFLLRLPDGQSTVQVDGQERGGGRMSLPPGRHVLRIEMADRLPYERQVHIVAGETTPLAPVLRWAPSAREERLTSTSGWVIAWSVTGLGAGLALAGGLMALRSARELNDFGAEWRTANERLLDGSLSASEAQRERVARERYAHEQRSARRSVLLASSAATAGVITTVIGIVLLGKTRTQRDVDLDAHVAATRDGAAVHVQGRF